MQIATITLPIADNDNNPLTKDHAHLTHTLLLQFGGWSAVNIRGAWRDPETGKVYHDESIRYEIASEWTPRYRNALREIARVTAFRARQECIMVTFPDGVEFIAPEAEAEATTIAA